jgi:membrane protein
MALNVKNFWQVLKAAFAGWSQHKAPRLGAALSYYTVFAMPPLFVIVIFIASLVFDPHQVRSQLFGEFGGLVGEKSAQAIQSAMDVQYQGNKGLFASGIAIATLLVTATGFFIELQDALNTIWGVEAKPGQGILGFIRNRLLSFAMVVGIGFLLLVSLVLTAALSAFGKYLSYVAEGLGVVTTIAGAVVSFGVITLLFAMLFKVLPDVKIAWRNVRVGAVFTAFLFTAGKFLLGFYIGRSSVVSAYGAAGSLVLILLWVYYSAQILFLGAEMTRAYAERSGAPLEPSSHARWLEPTAESATPTAPPRGAKSAPLPATGGKRVRADRQEQLVSELKEEIESLRELVHSR